MTPLGDPRRHYWLIKGMACATGTDVVHAFGEGRLDNADWAAMVRDCRRCGWAENCADWLARGGAACVAPAPCRNRRRLAVLRVEEELAQ